MENSHYSAAVLEEQARLTLVDVLNALPPRYPLVPLLDVFPRARRTLYNRRSPGLKAWIVHIDETGRKSRRLYVDLAEACAYWVRRGYRSVVEAMIERILKLERDGGEVLIEIAAKVGNQLREKTEKHRV